MARRARLRRGVHRRASFVGMGNNLVARNLHGGRRDAHPAYHAWIRRGQHPVSSPVPRRQPLRPARPSDARTRDARMRSRRAGRRRAHAGNRFDHAAQADGRGRQRDPSAVQRAGQNFDRRIVLQAGRCASAGEAVPAAAHADLRREHHLAVGDGRGGTARMRRAVGRVVRAGRPGRSDEAMGDGGRVGGREWQDGRSQKLADGFPDSSRGDARSRR